MPDGRVKRHGQCVRDRLATYGLHDDLVVQLDVVVVGGRTVEVGFHFELDGWWE